MNDSSQMKTFEIHLDIPALYSMFSFPDSHYPDNLSNLAYFSDLFDRDTCWNHPAALQVLASSAHPVWMPPYSEHTAQTRNIHISLHCLQSALLHISFIFLTIPL